MEHYLLPILLFFYTIGYSSGYIETVEEFGCQDTEFRLTCRHLDSHIAILDGNFYPEDPAEAGNLTTACSTASIQNTTIEESSNETMTSTTLATNTKDYSVKNIRLSLNRRCSGINHCSYILPFDTPGGRGWGAGLITFKYVCIAAHRITSYCNINILLNNTFNEGFIQSPGYPRYYVGDINCNWKLIAPEGQLIQLMFVDISLRINYTHEGVTCVDQLSVTENDQPIYNSCLEDSSLQTIMSTSSHVDINLEIKSKTMFPKRGVLLYYKGIGCPTLEAPNDGYLVDRNETIANYMCNVGYVFRDTQSRARILHCVGGNAWHTELPDCINTTITFNLNNLTTLQTTSEVLVLNNNPTADITNLTMQSPMQIQEYVVPVLLVLALFSVNAVIVYYIYKQRKRQEMERIRDAKAKRERYESPFNVDWTIFCFKCPEHSAHLAEEELAVIR